MDRASETSQDSNEGSGSYHWNDGRPIEVPKSELKFRLEIDELRQSNQLCRSETTNARRLTRALFLVGVLLSTALTIHPVKVSFPEWAKYLLTSFAVLLLPPICFFRTSEHQNFRTWIDIEGLPIYMMTGLAFYLVVFA